MTQQFPNNTNNHSKAIAWAPLVLLAIMVMAATALLLMPVKMPIGAMYWDIFLYLDATQRITNGQIPVVDFFAPVGALGYYLGAASINLFPNGQPILAVSWSLMVITVPLMALVSYDTGRRSPLQAMALTIPFAIFAFVPFNTTIAYTFPGSDAFGIYNRQASQLLYILVAAALFVRSQWLMALVVGLTMTALFYLKITGFVAAGLICLMTLMSGRITLSATTMAITLFAAITVALELGMNGMVSAYITDILTLISMNQDGLTKRMMQSASKTAGTTFSTLGLGLLIFVSTGASARNLFKNSTPKLTIDHPSVWLAIVLVAGLLFESQNTGGQELVYLWPVIIMIIAAIKIPSPRPVVTGVTIMLAACAVLPPTMSILQASLRSTVGGLIQTPVQHTQLRQMGNVLARPEMLARAEDMRMIYPRHTDIQQALNSKSHLPSFQLFSDFDFHLLNHLTTDAVVNTLKQLEANGLTYTTITTMNFSNPFAWLLNKDAPKHIAIGADPNRAVPPLDDQTRRAMAEADIALIPLCPNAYITVQLLAHYAEPLAQHNRVSLTQCYDALIHPRIDFAF